MPSLHWKGKQERPLSQASPLAGAQAGSGKGPSLYCETLIHPPGRAAQSEATDRLILGDNVEIMAALLPDYEGRVQLIYADPPFFTNRKYHTRIGRGEDSRLPRNWVLAEGYHDLWGDVDAYLTFLYERLELMYRLLSPTGTLYLHLDWHADAYGRLLLDELFGSNHLLNEIIWAYHGPSPIRSAFNRKHDVILAYTKGERYTFNADAVRVPYDNSTLKTFASSSKAGFGKVPDLARGKVPEDWWYFPVVARLHRERTGYPTQKPEALLDRIILASSNPGDLVADFFCGSGTAPVAAARHRRRFLAADASWRAIHTTRARLLKLASSPIMLEHTASAPWQIQPAAPTNFGLRRESGKVSLEPREEIIYWEVDPTWDGQLFRSAAQAARPARDGEIAAWLPLGEPETGPGAVCVRLVMASGEQFQIRLSS